MSAPLNTRLVADIPTSRSTRIRVQIVDYPTQSVVAARVFALGRGPGEENTFFATQAGFSIQLKDLPGLRAALAEAEETLKAAAFRPLDGDVYPNAADLEAGP